MGKAVSPGGCVRMLFKGCRNKDCIYSHDEAVLKQMWKYQLLQFQKSEFASPGSRDFKLATLALAQECSEKEKLK
jgi:hypothetical protein